MKAYINKILLAGATVAMMGLTACVGDLNQLPEDSKTLTPDQFNENPREYISGAMAKCYSSIAVSGQGGAGDSDISGLDNGRSCWSRAIFMLNEMTTDECAWIWKDSGVFDLNTDTWSTNNENIFGTYSRLYTHIAVCNDFIRLTRNLDEYGININQGDDKGISQNEIDQFVMEARALRGLSYFYVIDLFGNAAYCWDSQLTGEEPPAMNRKDLFDAVVGDLEDVLANWDAVHGNKPVVYGRIGKDAVEALLCKFYLNTKVFRGTETLEDGSNCYAKCLTHCQNIIGRHQTGPYGNGLAKSYLSLFCGNNDMFAPGGSLSDQNETLWNIPYQYQLTESYGGSSFLILAAISDQTKSLPSWYGINGQWTCMHARTQFSEKFPISGGVSANGDERVWLWGTEPDGFSIYNTDFSNFKDGYTPIKFTNVQCNADGSMPMWNDEETGLPRAGVKYNDDPSKNYGIPATETFADTDYPVIRLAEIYLTAAEAILRGNVGSRADALTYVNYIRQRAGLDSGNLWTDTQLTLENLLDERARELYWENCRRTDLVRYDMFAGSAYNWNWKNNVPSGTGIPAHMNLFPIPSQVINSYSTPYPQNPGY
ncbi:MAG: RagB/SusD family nutrient uptake outer membrane protein [Muribaculaceae bacterium]|nr:RagB/SusD family nutrient uptake outer membrane protein [Muribaculaceae bacterium]